MELNQFTNIDIILDKANDNIIQKQSVSAGDLNGRTLTAQITDEGVVGEVPGASLNLIWKNSANNWSDLTPFEIIDHSKSIFKITYPQNMLTPGKVTAHIQILHSGKVTHTKPFEIIVAKLAGQMRGVLQTAEFSALVDALAKTNGFEGDIRNLDLKKADQQSLIPINYDISELRGKKVDKGGNEQVTWGMISQDAKEQFLGNIPPAVVGKNAVNTTNIVDRAVTLEKMTSIGKTATMAFSGVSDFFDIDNTNNLIVIPEGTRIYYDNTHASAEQESLALIQTHAYNSLIFDKSTKRVSIIADIAVDYTDTTYLIAIIGSGRGNIRGVYYSTSKYHIDGKAPETGLINQLTLSSLINQTQDISDTFDMSLQSDATYNSQKKSVEVASGGYFFMRKKMQQTTKNFIVCEARKDYRDVQFRLGVRRIVDNVVVGYYNFEKNGLIFTFDESKYADEFAEYTNHWLEIRIDAREVAEPIYIDKLLIGTDGIPVNLSINSNSSDKIAYCDPNASGGNGSQSNPFAEIQDAIDAGFDTIVAKKGIYKKPIVSTHQRDKLHIYCDSFAETAGMETSDEGIQIICAEKLNLTEVGGQLQQAYTAIADSRLDQVFIKKTMPILSESSRPAYNVSLWELSDKISDHKQLKPVLTVEETNETGTFTYDGTKLIINPFAPNNEYYLSDEINSPVDIKNVKDLYLTGINAKFGYNSSFITRNCNKAKAIRCSSIFSALSDGFSGNESIIDYERCEAYHNRNDGFNFHVGGHQNLFDCRSNFNRDDGVSHHENCTGVVRGGDFSDNGKGAIIPVNNAKVDVYDVYARNCRYGFYVSGTETLDANRCYVFNSIFLDNEVDIFVSGFNVVGKNNVYDSKNVAEGSTFLEY